MPNWIEGTMKVVTKNGQVLSCDFEGDMAKSTGIGYVPHWATCPAAGQFRRKERNMRLIDADAMAESLEHDVELDARALDSTDLVGPEREHVQFDKDCKQNCMWYLTEQPTVPAPRWHRVEERLPNVDEKVLVFAIGKLDGFIGDTVIALTSMSDTNRLNHHKKVDEPYWLDPWQYFLTDYRITHWMPLPEPPKEDA